MLGKAENVIDVKELSYKEFFNLQRLSQELIMDCTIWQTVSWIKIKYLEYEKRTQMFFLL